jgi:Xaa-Pro aminopeptidase
MSLEPSYTLLREKSLIEAQKRAQELFSTIEDRALIRSGITERTLNSEVYNLALELFGIKKYWHKRIVRAGPNTLLPYQENPPDLMIEKDDILFLDFGPIFEEWEADFGRTYVIGNNLCKQKLKEDVERIWQLGKTFFEGNKEIKSFELFNYVRSVAADAGYDWAMEHCGHLIGEFPHENIARDQVDGFIHSDNQGALRDLHPDGSKKFWILEVHITRPKEKIGAFFEQLLNVEEVIS